MKIQKRFFLAASIAAIAFVLSGTETAKAAEALKVGVSAGPYGDILEFASDLAAKEGLQVKVIEFSDWTVINEALNSGDIDVNNFQHIPYLQNQIEARGYDLVPVRPSIVVPMGIYSSGFKAIEAIPAGGSVAIPNDPTNAARALFLLEKAGLIKLAEGVATTATILDVESNPKNIKFIELDAAQLPRSLSDVDAAVITLNYAVLAGLKPESALFLEDEHSKWALAWVVRRDNLDNPDIRRFIDLYTSDAVREFIVQKFHGTIIPTW